MMTNYHTGQRPAYECSSRRDRLTTPSCRPVTAACVDAAVAGALLNALTPGQVALALSAAGEVAGRHQRASRAAELAAERARYEADRAERAFGAVEPENRLVARSLEARWEARPPAIDRVGRPGPATSSADRAPRLNAAGQRPAHGRPFDIDAVQWIRHAHKIPVPDPYRPGEISVAEAARRLGCSTSVIYHWIRTGQLTARRGSASRFCIPWNQPVHAGCQRRIEQSGHLNPAARRTKPRQRR